MSVVVDVRTTRLIRTARALTLAHKDLPAETKRQVLDLCSAVSLLAQADQFSLLREAVGDLLFLVNELSGEVKPIWLEAVASAGDRLLQVIEVGP